ncbi:MAG: hypothetical protein M3020_25450 [Myxococcota bacterium]|nr:hypothetical protein [Myxococcota bacterium]
MDSIELKKPLDLKVRRVLKTSLRGGTARTQIAGDISNNISATFETAPNPLPPLPDNSGIPNSATGPGGEGGSYKSRGATSKR